MWAISCWCRRRCTAEPWDSLNQNLYPKIPYDPARDFVPVAKLDIGNLMLVTRPDFPAANVREFIDYAKRNPLQPLGFEAVGDTPEQFVAFLKADREPGAHKVKVSGAKLE